MRRAPPRVGGLAVALGAALAGVVFAWAGVGTGSAPVPPPIVPKPSPLTEYATSNACRSCHPSEHASWHRSFHRTMTQAATAETVRAPAATLSLDGASYVVARRGGEVWASGGGEPARFELATGSHHYQAYWTAGHEPGTLAIFPLVYLLPEARWIPRRDAFLEPPDAEPHAVRWASGCIQCHTTAGRSGRDPREGFDTDAGELGIACEACHGPGRAHVAKYDSPLVRYRAYARGGADASIVNPSRLDAERASMICGRCHSFSVPKDEEEWWRRGDTRVYGPGDDLWAARVLVDAPTLDRPGEALVEADTESLFWPDGAVRVGGREYNGLVHSACFRDGQGDRKLSCLSCHSMHDSEPAGQIARGRVGDRACLGCHASLGADVPAHTHHAAGSPGSACVACHMAKTTYALLKGIASHTIDRPIVRRGSGARPVACNLCHLDRSLAWTQRQLRAWSSPRPAPDDASDGDEEPAGVAWLLAGDAAQRVVAAAAFGADGARAATPAGWAVRPLARALEDPYAAVRIVATRSLHALAGFDDLAVDPEASAPERARVRRDVEARAPSSSARATPSPALLDALVARRDDHAISISE